MRTNPTQVALALDDIAFGPNNSTRNIKKQDTLRRGAAKDANTSLALSRMTSLGYFPGVLP